MLDSLTLPPLPTLHGERVILRSPRDSDVDDRLRHPIDPAKATATARRGGGSGTAGTQKVVDDTAVINNRSITVEIERCGHGPTVRTGLSVDDVGTVIRGLEGEPDVTVMVLWAGTTDENVMFVVNGASVFLGLNRDLDRVFQYVARDNADRQGAQQFMIAGEPTDIESRYVMDIETAATVVKEWLRSGEQSSLGWWERQ